MRPTAAVTLALLLASVCTTAGTLSEQSFQRTITKTVKLKYTLCLPDGYDPKGKDSWPMILFLHGAGERGDDLSKVTSLGPMAYAQRTKGFPFIVLAPLCPLGKAWSPDELIALLDEIEKEYRVNTQAVYVTGYSMGGAGTWALAMEHPDRFAAVAPVCGRVIPLLIGNLWRTPIWAFHGEKDDVVPISNSREVVEWLQQSAKNENVKFTVIPGAGHQIWSDVYGRGDLYSWFMKYRKDHPEKSSQET